MKLDIGGGQNPKKGFLSVDQRDVPETAYLVDLEWEKLPIKDSSVDEIYSHHTFEHIKNIIPLMNECYRVLKKGGEMIIIVPHKDCSLAWQDPTHQRYFVEGSMKFFCGDYLKKYKLDYGITANFDMISEKLFVPDGRPEYITEIHYHLRK